MLILSLFSVIFVD